MPTKNEVRDSKGEWKKTFDPESDSKDKKIQYVWHQVKTTKDKNIYKTGNSYNWKILANLNTFHPTQWNNGTLVYCPTSSADGGRSYSRSLDAFFGPRGYNCHVITGDKEYTKDSKQSSRINIILDCQTANCGRS